MLERNFSLGVPYKVFPRPLWLYILSFLDGKSLRNSLLVNKSWFKAGADPKLRSLSNRGCIPIIKKLQGSNIFHKIHSILRYDENLKMYMKKVKNLDEILNPFIYFIYVLRIFPYLFMLIFFPNAVTFVGFAFSIMEVISLEFSLYIMLSVIRVLSLLVIDPISVLYGFLKHDINFIVPFLIYFYWFGIAIITIFSFRMLNFYYSHKHRKVENISFIYDFPMVMRGILIPCLCFIIQSSTQTFLSFCVSIVIYLVVKHYSKRFEYRKSTTIHLFRTIFFQWILQSFLIYFGFRKYSNELVLVSLMQVFNIYNHANFSTFVFEVLFPYPFFMLAEDGVIMNNNQRIDHFSLIFVFYLIIASLISVASLYMVGLLYS